MTKREIPNVAKGWLSTLRCWEAVVPLTDLGKNGRLADDDDDDDDDDGKVSKYHDIRTRA